MNGDEDYTEEERDAIAEDRWNRRKKYEDDMEEKETGHRPHEENE